MRINCVSGCRVIVRASPTRLCHWSNSTCQSWKVIPQSTELLPCKAPEHRSGHGLGYTARGSLLPHTQFHRKLCAQCPNPGLVAVFVVFLYMARTLVWLACQSRRLISKSPFNYLQGISPPTADCLQYCYSSRQVPSTLADTAASDDAV